MIKIVKKRLKLHKNNCKEFLWTIEEENNFYSAINNLQESYKYKFSMALNSYNMSQFKLKQLFDMQVNYICSNVNKNYLEMLNENINIFKRCRM